LRFLDIKRPLLIDESLSPLWFDYDLSKVQTYSFKSGLGARPCRSPNEQRMGARGDHNTAI
jgi:hypothetical protein